MLNINVVRHLNEKETMWANYSPVYSMTLSVMEYTTHGEKAFAKLLVGTYLMWPFLLPPPPPACSTMNTTSCPDMTPTPDSAVTFSVGKPRVVLYCLGTVRPPRSRCLNALLGSVHTVSCQVNNRHSNH